MKRCLKLRIIYRLLAGCYMALLVCLLLSAVLLSLYSGDMKGKTIYVHQTIAKIIPGYGTQSTQNRIKSDECN
jgi:hypothetical protein